MKTAGPLILIVTAITLIAAWMMNDGPARALDKLWKRGFDASAEKKIRIQAQFRGTWKLVDRIDGEGRRQPPESTYFLSITDDNMTKWRINELESHSIKKSVTISDRGEVWERDPRTLRREKVASLRIAEDELHVVFGGVDGTEVYVAFERSQ